MYIPPISVGLEPGSIRNDTRDNAGQLGAIGAFPRRDLCTDTAVLWLGRSFAGSVGGDDPADFVRTHVGSLTRSVITDLQNRYDDGLDRQIMQSGTVGREYEVALAAEGAVTQTATLSVGLGSAAIGQQLVDYMEISSDHGPLAEPARMSGSGSDLGEDARAHAQRGLDHCFGMMNYFTELLGGTFPGGQLDAVRNQARARLAAPEREQQGLESLWFNSAETAYLRRHMDALSAMTEARFVPLVTVTVNAAETDVYRTADFEASAWLSPAL